MNTIKDKIYNYLVRKNGRVWYEYERYVMEHIEEHHLHRFRHLRVLIKLNWFYRVKKGNTPYLYWDVPLEPNLEKNEKVERKIDNLDEKQTEIKTGSQSMYNVSEYDTEKRQTAYAFAIGMKDYSVISFDVFDTLILRNLNLPEHLFMVLGEKFGIFNYIKWRQQAEKEVRERNLLLKGHRECTLREIYERVSYWTGIDVDYGMRVEFETEMQFCTANPYMFQVYQILLEMGKKIYATSNMYLPKCMLKELLEKCGYEYFQDIIVSCDYHCSKRTGNLFEVLKSKEENEKIVHVGDNKETDIKGAGLAKIDSKYYQSCREKGEKYRARGFSSLIGSAYYALVNNKLHNGTKICVQYSLMWEFGYKYGGMAALGYANWIHEKAKQEAKDIVVFLARDGALFKQAYDMMFHDIPSCYFSWSRIAAIRNVVSGETRNQILDRIFTENIKKRVSVNELLDILGWGELKDKMRDSGIYTEALLCEENAVMVKNFLVNNWNVVIKISEKIEGKTIDYIKNVIGNQNKICLVDLGWTGKNALVLKKIMIKQGYKKEDIGVYLMGSICKMQNPIEICNELVSCYMFSFNHNREIHDTFCKLSTYALDILEKMYSEASCSFAGISAKGDYLFAAPEIENYEAYREIAKGIIDFCEDYLSYYSKYSYLMNISGYDAWIPLRKAINDKETISELFSNLVYVQGVNTSFNSRAKFVNLLK